MKKTININDHMPKGDTAGFRIEQDYGRIRTWFADLIGWLLAPILKPWMAKLTVNAELVEARLAKHYEDLFQLKGFQLDTIKDKATIKKDVVDLFRRIEKADQAIDRQEAAFNLVKPNINKVEQLDKFMSVIVTKMDWKLMDEPGARKDNLESWTCGLLNSMNRSQLAMERLLGLKLGDTAADDRLEKIDEFHNQFKDVNSIIAGLFTLLKLHWITQTISNGKYERRVLVSRWIEQHGEQRKQDVNAYLTWRAKIDAIVKDHSERLHDLDNMHNLD